MTAGIVTAAQILQRPPFPPQVFRSSVLHTLIAACPEIHVRRGFPGGSELAQIVPFRITGGPGMVRLLRSPTN